MPERAMQAESPASLPQPGPGVREIGQVQAGQRPGAPDNEIMRQIAGALSALAGRVDRMDERLSAGLRPKVTPAERTAALEQAREFVADLRTRPASEAERISNELAVARYLTGE